MAEPLLEAGSFVEMPAAQRDWHDSVMEPAKTTDARGDAELFPADNEHAFADIEPSPADFGAWGTSERKVALALAEP